MRWEGNSNEAIWELNEMVFGCYFHTGRIRICKDLCSNNDLCYFSWVSLLPLTWKVIQGKKWLQVVTPIVFLLLIGAVTPASGKPVDRIASYAGNTEKVTEHIRHMDLESKEKITEAVVQETVITETPVQETEQETESASDLTMDVLDVGQGLPLLFRTGDQYMLYDGGDRDYSSKVVSYLKKKNVQTLEYVIAPDYSTDSRAYQSFTGILEQKNLQRIVPSVGETYTFGNVSFTILAPNGSGYGDENDYFICIRGRCKIDE